MSAKNSYTLRQRAESAEESRLFLTAEVADLRKQNAELLLALQGVRQLAEKWHKDAIDTGFAMSEPAEELFDVLDAASTAASAQQEQDRRDAERYRWLKNYAASNEVSRWWHMADVDEMEMEIDRAMECGAALTAKQDGGKA